MASGMFADQYIEACSEAAAGLRGLSTGEVITVTCNLCLLGIPLGPCTLLEDMRQ